MQPGGSLDVRAVAAKGEPTRVYKRLRDGRWGVLVQGAVEVGEQITVTRRDGSAVDEIVSRVIWRRDGLALCATQNGDSKPVPKSAATTARAAWPDLRASFRRHVAGSPETAPVGEAASGISLSGT